MPQPPPRHHDRDHDTTTTTEHDHDRDRDTATHLLAGYGGFVLAVRVSFTASPGTITFRSAGFGFYQQGG